MLPALEQHFGSAKRLIETERELQELLRSRGIFFGEGLLPTYAHAFLAPQARIQAWAEQAERLVESAERAANLLVSDDSFFHRMGLGDNARELVAVYPGYKRICVLCRPDGIPVGNDVRFVEVNSDSPAMMMFIDVVAECMLELEAFAWLRAKRPSSAADKLLGTLLDCYREFASQPDAMPNIAIVDWEGQKTRFEHKRLAEHFETNGCATVVCDPRALSRSDGKLWLGDRRIDLVYRRALSSEMIERAETIAPLLDCYRDHTVCMVNPLRSYIAGVKAVLSHLSVEGSVVPRSVLLDTDAKRAQVRASPSTWVLKKSESHGGEDVILPTPENAAAWQRALAASVDETWIAQEYLDIPKVSISIVEDGRIVEVDKHYNWNPFVFGGKYAGGLVRVSSTPLINITLGGGLLPTFCT